MSDFPTKDSGARVEFATGMRRDISGGKPRFDLMIPRGQPYSEQMLTRLAALYARGSVKYGDRNWERASTQEELDRFHESAARHFAQWMAGETDEDHAAATLFNVIGAEYVKWRMMNAATEASAT